MTSSGVPGAAPPPSPALLALLANMGPAKARAPARALLVVAVVACAYPAWTLATSPLRADLGTLPVAWFAGIAALWFAGFVTPLRFAMVPPRGQVLPDGDKAFRAALVAAVALSSACFFALGRAGPSVVPSRTWQDCIIASAKVSVPTLLAGAFVLRRVALAGAWLLGAALGAAGGALGGLTLHFTCASVRPPHVVLAHCGGIVLGAILGALVFSLLIRARR